MIGAAGWPVLNWTDFEGLRATERRKGHPGMGQMADAASGREDGSREDR